MKRIAKWLAAIAGIGWAGWRFHTWRQTRLAELAENALWVETAVGRIEYAIAGSGPVLLVSHGGPGGYDQISLMQEFVEAGFQVIMPSRPGYLGTPLATGKTMEEQAKAMIALLDALQIEKAAVIGMSAGGPMALHMVLHHPKRVWALVMLSAVSQTYQPNEAAADSMLGRLFINDGGLTLLDIGMWLLEAFSLRFPLASARFMMQTESSLSASQINKRIGHMKQNPAQITWFKELIRSTGPMSVRKAGLDNDLVQLAAQPRLPLAKINAPTFIIHGREDTDVPFSHAKFVAATVPGAQLHPLPNSGHLIWLGEEWAAVQQQLMTFLNQHRMIT